MSQGFLERIKQKWGVGPWGAIAILAAFSLAGSSSLLASRPLLGVVMPEDAPSWLYILTYVAVVTPVYQVFLLAYGTLLGQFGFFWEKEKQLGRMLIRLFQRRGR